MKEKKITHKILYKCLEAKKFKNIVNSGILNTNFPKSTFDFA